MIINAVISYDASTRRFTAITPEGAAITIDAPADIYSALFAHIFRHKGPFSTLSLTGEIHVTNSFDNRANIALSINEARQWAERYSPKPASEAPK